MHDAFACGHPLRVAASEARRGTHRIAVVAETSPYVGDGFEAPMRVLRETRHVFTVVHVPTVDAVEVLADCAALQGGVGFEVGSAIWKVVEMVSDEKKRVDCWPLRVQGERLTDCAHRRHHTNISCDHN